MASPVQEIPRIDIEISFDRASHSFSQTSSPKLIVNVTSHANTPITLFTWNTPLSLPRTLTSNGIIITDTETREDIKTASIMVQRAPLKRTRGGPDEQYYLTLQPNNTVELSTGFGRGGGSVKPQPKAVVERGLELDEHGNEMNLRRSKFATGVDSLEPGRRYDVRLNAELLSRIWWAPTSKEDILVDSTGEGSYVQDYEWRKESLDFHVQEAEISVED
ncbi:hypothetical protein N0V90_012705 [Kalmusia sp. IMI 367209]|nr:hypothetical protein N0V90_012705 [Kalmusia sp. IMI 367209]